MKRFITADYHLGHFNIIKYCDRPFKTLEEMNETIIKNHNERVKPEDEVYYVGDFCFKNSPGGKMGEGVPIKSEYWLSKLNGKFIFIRGNHDRNNSLKVITVASHIKYGKNIIHLVHNPDFVDMDCKINLVGHVHNYWKFKRIKRGDKVTDAINVGVDMNKFRPVTFEEVFVSYECWKKKEGLK